MLIGQRLRVGFLKADLQALRCWTRPCALYQIAGDVHAGHLQAILRGHQGELPGTAAHVQ